MTTKELINYHLENSSTSGWTLSEDHFDPQLLAKTETIFSLGNGYMGSRATLEENYPTQTRGHFISGSFNKSFGEKEVSELPNIADTIQMEIIIDDVLFSMTEGTILSYTKNLDLKKAILTREVCWKHPNGKEFLLRFERFISKSNLHIMGQKVKIQSISKPAKITVNSGIDGRITNSGTQHFEEGELRLFNQKILKFEQITSESQIKMINYAKHAFYLNKERFSPEQIIFMERRKIFMNYPTIELSAGETVTIEKLSGYYTARDQENYQEIEIESLKLFEDSGNYDELLVEHTKAWEEAWKHYDVTIHGSAFDQLAVNFSIYHLIIMTPAHDNRMSIGAKGLTGEGYKGHAFWDNEIFIVPFYTVTNPQVARNLLEYRYLSLSGAIKKAKENNYEGAMFPWESAWLSDGEVTPVYGAADIITGKYTKIWSGFIEQHITADIAYATWQYFQYTGDIDFMEKYGYELIMATAIFWQSRLEWNEDLQRYEINEVIGPDEYKEHVDNNAFTNYMAYWNIETALHCYNELAQEKPDLLKTINQKWPLEKYVALWQSEKEKIYLPKPNAELIIPQDDDYLAKAVIDLTKYKNDANVGSLFLEYNLDQINEMQITKQADVLILLYLLDDYFSNEVKRANWDYYEPKTMHDSSLSMSTHSILASDMDDASLAYDMFEKACRIDMGQNPHSSDHGIHSASLGGIWQSIVFGFAGVRLRHHHLEIQPKLPMNWNQVSFPLYWKGYHIKITADNKDITFENLLSKPVELEINKQKYTILTNQKIAFPYKKEKIVLG